jgi:hypothetical protein
MRASSSPRPNGLPTKSSAPRRGHEDDRCSVPLAAQLAQDLEAAPVRQHEVQEDEVEVIFPGLFDADAPVGGVHDGVPLGFEVVAEAVRHAAVVFDQQDASHLPL